MLVVSTPRLVRIPRPGDDARGFRMPSVVKCLRVEQVCAQPFNGPRSHWPTGTPNPVFGRSKRASRNVASQHLPQDPLLGATVDLPTQRAARQANCTTAVVEQRNPRLERQRPSRRDQPSSGCRRAGIGSGRTSIIRSANAVSKSVPWWGCLAISGAVGDDLGSGSTQ